MGKFDNIIHFSIAIISAMFMCACNGHNIINLLTDNDVKKWKAVHSDNFYLSFEKQGHFMKRFDYNGAYAGSLCQPYPMFKIEGNFCVKYLYSDGYSFILDTLLIHSISKKHLDVVSYEYRSNLIFTTNYDQEVDDSILAEDIYCDLLKRVCRLDKEKPINLLSECKYMVKGDLDSLGLSISYVPDNRSAERTTCYEIGKPVKRNQNIYCWAYKEILHVDKDGKLQKEYQYGIEFEYKKRHKGYEFKRKRKYRLK